MQVLVIGSGGREHAITLKLLESSKVDAVWCYPGNAGMAQAARIPKLENPGPDALAEFAADRGIDLTVVGAEAYLAEGIVDAFRARGLSIVGPTQSAARIESSKAFAKDLMRKYGIPTAAYQVFTEYQDAKAYIEEMGTPIVIKADGLAAGKGVVVADDVETAVEAVRGTLSGKRVGEAGRRVVVEEFMEGQEVSILALCDGKTCVPLMPSQDHKAVGEGDQGPNTGGMGAYSPVPAVDEALQRGICSSILLPTLQALHQEGIIYTGVLYAGLMLTEAGPKVVEFNCRFGDPETQALLPRLKTDLAEVLLAVGEGRLSSLPPLTWDPRACVSVIAASQGYPGAHETGFSISGLDALTQMQDVFVYHGATALRGDEVVTAGGRVLSISALGDDIQAARDRAYEAISHLEFENMYYRRDIAWRALTGKKDK
ncbi:MAG: phosphoribosylamine--glycine ligase [Firmicutes bacterium]|jgi:phosphoribosylamine--glycine ligase|nr:phosphoribosylamine--glycine ligase [Bacillota bacterium]